MSLPQTITEIRQEGANELREATPQQKAMLGTAACALAFEWGTGNEALIGMVGGHVLQATNDTLLTAMSAGGASFGEQALFGMTAAVSIHHFPRVMGAVRKKVVGNGNTVDGAQTGEQATDIEGMAELEKKRFAKARKIGNRFLTAFALGTSVSALKNNATREHTLQENAKNVVVDAGLIGGGVAGIAAAAAGATNVGRSMGLQHEANAFVDVISSPFTYMGLFGAKSAADLRKWRRNKRDAQAASVADDREQSGGDRKVLLTLPDRGEVECQSNPSPEDTEALWEIVQTGFFDLNRKSYEKQDMTREEFEADMRDPAVLKYIAYDAERNPLGCMTVHQGLDSITWADREVLEKTQEAQGKPNPPYYVGTIVVQPDQQGSGTATHLLQGAFMHFKNDLPDALCFFDCADANFPWLAQFVEKSAEPSEADNFDGLDLTVSEMYRKYWVKSPATGKITETNDLPEDADRNAVLDSQHYYSIAFQK